VVVGVQLPGLGDSVRLAVIDEVFQPPLQAAAGAGAGGGSGTQGECYKLVVQGGVLDAWGMHVCMRACAHACMQM